MPGSMSQTDLVADLKAMLSDAATKFTAPNDADFVRHLQIAALDMARARPRTLVGELTLQADQHAYPAPDDLVRPKVPLWGTTELQRTQPWNQDYPGPLPRLRLVETGAGREVHLWPAPTTEQIARLGERYTYYYYAAHVVGDPPEETTIVPADRHLLLVRAAAQALQELANKGVMKPVRLSDVSGGVGSMPKNGTPAALADQLLRLFREMAA